MINARLMKIIRILFSIFNIIFILFNLTKRDQRYSIKKSFLKKVSISIVIFNFHFGEHLSKIIILVNQIYKLYFK